MIVAALDFRVPPEAPYPASLADIHYGIRWRKSQAAAWNGRPDQIGAMGTSSGAHQAMLLGMRPHDPRYAALPSPAGTAAVDGTVGCVIMVSPVIDPLGRYLYAKGLRQDVTPPAGFADRVVPMHDQYWQTEEAMAEGAWRVSWPVGSGRPCRPCCAWYAPTRRGIRARTSMSSCDSIARLVARST